VEPKKEVEITRKKEKGHRKGGEAGRTWGNKETKEGKAAKK